MVEARESVYSLLADVTVGVHAAFVLFVVGGQVAVLLGWWRRWAWVRNPVFRIGHLLAIAFVVLEAWFGIVCPLTWLENELRALAGVPVYESSFVGYWIHRLLFYDAPPWVFAMAYTAFAALVAASFVGYPPRRHGSAG